MSFDNAAVREALEPFGDADWLDAWSGDMDSLFFDEQEAEHAFPTKADAVPGRHGP